MVNNAIFKTNEEVNEKFIGSAMVVELTGLSQQLLRYHIDEGKFPQPFKLAKTNCPFWEKSTVMSFFEPVNPEDWEDDKKIAVYLKLCRKMGITPKTNGN